MQTWILNAKKTELLKMGGFLLFKSRLQSMIPGSARVSPGSSNAQSQASPQHTESAPTFDLLLLPPPQAIQWEAAGSSKNTTLCSGGTAKNLGGHLQLNQKGGWTEI